ncbi:hypothetical protein GGI35DRAFT_414519 [Trichoderma velutinum]
MAFFLCSIFPFSLFTLILESAFYSHCVDEGHDHSILPTTRCLHSFYLRATSYIPKYPSSTTRVRNPPSLCKRGKAKSFTTAYPLLLRKVLLSMIS